MMDLQWVKINSSLISGLTILNNTDINKFDKFLEHIMTSRNSDKLFTEHELIKLEKILKLNTDEVALLVKSTSYLMKRMCKYVLKPSHLYEQLVRGLKINDDKASCILKYWSRTMNESISELGVDNLGNIDTVADVEWQLNIELSSNTIKKSKEPRATFKLQLANDEHEDLYLDLPHDQLYGLFQQLGSIQVELDNLDK